MGWMLVSAAALFVSISVARPDEAAHSTPVIVDFRSAAGADPESTARALCLRFGCTVRHVYRILPGMAVSGGDTVRLARAAEVARVVADPVVRLAPHGPHLMGSPPGALVVVGALPGDTFAPVRRWRMRTVPTAAPPAAASPAAAPFGRVGSDPAAGSPAGDRGDAVRIARELLRDPMRPLWLFDVVDEDGRGRASDVLAALETLVTMRFAVGVVFMPLAFAEAPRSSPDDPARAPVLRLCRMVDDVLRRGLLVVTDLDRGCLADPALP